MAIAIKELRERLAAIDLPVNLTAQTAGKLQEGETRGRIISALKPVESTDDRGARLYLHKTLDAAGLLISDDAEQPSAAVKPAPEANDHAPARPARPEPAPQATEPSTP